MGSHVDPWGRTIVDYETVQELLLAGTPLDDILVDPDARIEAFNALLKERDKTSFSLHTPEPPQNTPEQEHAARAAEWLICEDLRGIDLRAFLVSLCSTPEQVARVHEEMDLFEARDLIPLLTTMVCLVDHFRRNKVVWGVGRGSSVASYVLFLIGVHRIDPLRYGLSIHDFLKD